MKIIAAIAILSALIIPFVQRSPNHEHIFPLDTQPEFLTEEMALELGDAVLEQEGLDSAQWEPRPDGRSTAPDGSTDEYLNRNSLNPNMGKIMFMKSNTAPRFVGLELREGEVVCSYSIAK